MSRRDALPRADVAARLPDSGIRHAIRKSRPLTMGQELVFFGVTFAVALGLQLIVVLEIPMVD